MRNDVGEYGNARPDADTHRVRRLLLLLLSTVVLVLCSGPAASVSAAGSAAGGPARARPMAEGAAARADALPTHFGIGLTAEPPDIADGGWLPESQVPWDYAYQYLAAGVNTGNGWRTWNEKAQFPLWYAQDAAADGYVPVFPYYMLLQSAGPCDACKEAERDLAHLNSRPLMRAFYADFAKLMQRLGTGTHDGIAGFGGTAIVHVEPDLSGYAEQAVLPGGDCFGFCTGGANDPSNLKASVASSGFAAVAGYPNTYRGFNLALLHLRDRFAPNVLLAFHVSDWASLFDIGSYQGSDIDAAALGRKVAAFADAAGVHRQRADTSAYDLVFNDVADRDAEVSGVWWDRRNQTFPNFHRWERYIGAVHGATGRPIVVWQIPEGNQFFDTEDGSAGHTRDNRAEYFFHHVGELGRAGVVALLFGKGNPSTTHTDFEGDGVTNPPSTCSSDGTSGPPICNDHPSHYPDDDGGYLRIQARRYYRAPVPLT
jgi:hypothetical protein